LLATRNFFPLATSTEERSMPTKLTTLIRGGVTYTGIERRGGYRVMDAGGLEPLPYAIVGDLDVVLARVADRVLATALLDYLEGGES